MKLEKEQNEILKHDERWALAESISRKLVDNYGDKVLAVAVCGGTAKGKDHDLSDLDLLFVSKEKIGTSHKFLYKDIVVEPFYITDKEGVEILHNPLHPLWFKYMSLVSTAAPLYEKEKSVLPALKQAMNTIPKENLEMAASSCLTVMKEFLNHIDSKADLYSFHSHAVDVCELAQAFVAYVNGKHYNSHTLGIVEEGRHFEKVPDDYYDLMVRLGTSCDLKEIRDTAAKLLENCIALGFRVGIGPEYYDSTDKIKV